MANEEKLLVFSKAELLGSHDGVFRTTVRRGGWCQAGDVRGNPQLSSRCAVSGREGRQGCRLGCPRQTLLHPCLPSLLLPCTTVWLLVLSHVTNVP